MKEYIDAAELEALLNKIHDSLELEARLAGKNEYFNKAAAYETKADNLLFFKDQLKTLPRLTAAGIVGHVFEHIKAVDNQPKL